MLNKDVGFQQGTADSYERADVLGNKMKSFKESVKMNSRGRKYSKFDSYSGTNNNNNGYMMEGRKDETFLMATSWVDYDFLDTYGMTLDFGKIV